MRAFLLPLLIISTLHGFSQNSVESKAVQYLIIENQVKSSDSIKILNEGLYMLHKIAVVDTCQNSVLYKVKKSSVHSKSFFFILKSNNEIYKLDNNSLIGLIDSVNKFLMQSNCLLNDEKKIKMYEYLIHANKYYSKKK